MPVILAFSYQALNLEAGGPDPGRPGLLVESK